MNNNPITSQRLNLPKVNNAPMSLMLLFCLFGFCMIQTPILTGLTGKVSSKPEATLRIAMVLQDLLIFIIPAIVVALVSTRLPAQLLAVNCRVSWRALLLAIIGLVVSIPAMNFVITWNENIHLPTSLSNVESMLRELEANAQAVTDSLMSGASIPSVIVSVLIVGVLAGFSEELFFRGSFQQLLCATRLNYHAAVWIVAFIFSLVHFQFFGFVPRLILGAYFGYLLLWTRSLWIPICVHVFNNSVVVISTWLSVNNPSDSSLVVDTIGTNMSDGVNVVAVIVSVILTIMVLIAIKKLSTKSFKKTRLTNGAFS